MGRPTERIKAIDGIAELAGLFIVAPVQGVTFESAVLGIRVNLAVFVRFSVQRLAGGLVGELKHGTGQFRSVLIRLKDIFPVAIIICLGPETALDSIQDGRDEFVIRSIRCGRPLPNRVNGKGSGAVRHTADIQRLVLFDLDCIFSRLDSKTEQILVITVDLPTGEGQNGAISQCLRYA